MTNYIITSEAIDEAAEAIRVGIDRRSIWDLAKAAAVEAAAPFIRAQALDDAAQELARLHGIGRKPNRDSTEDEKADYYAYAEHDGNHEAWLRARATTEVMS